MSSAAPGLFSRGERGFTLPEVLVTLAIVAVMALILLGVLDLARAALSSRRLQADPTGEIATVQNLLRQRIESLRPTAIHDAPVAGDGSDHEDGATVVGEPTRLSFDGPAPDSALPQALWHYRVSLSDQGELRLSSVSTLAPGTDPGDESLAGWTTATLLRGVAALRFQYFGEDPQGEGERWQSVWHSSRTSPQLIRLDLAWRDGDRRFWPMLIVRPWAGQGQTCTAAPDSRCRSGS